MTEARLPPSLAEGWTLVDFHATWCGPCQMLTPVIDALAKRYRGRVTVAKVDVDRSPHVAQAFAVASMPTLVLCRDGQEVDRRLGFQGERELAAWLDATAG
jgi:thioredoxin 1